MSKTTNPSWQDNDALLTYRVGPVLCCGPTLPIITITPPPSLTHLPGTNTAEPGIFKHGSYIVSATDLRYRFGVKQENWKQPGQVIIAQHGDLTRGYYVDEIKDVIHFPETGWGQLPAYLPRGIFTRTLLLNEQIYLYTEFEKLSQLQGTGYLAEYISRLEEIKQEEIKQLEETKTQSMSNQSVIRPIEKEQPAVKISDKTDRTNLTSNTPTVGISKNKKSPELTNNILPKNKTIENTGIKSTAQTKAATTVRSNTQTPDAAVEKSEKNKTETLSAIQLQQEKPSRVNTEVKNKTILSKQKSSSTESSAPTLTDSITNKNESTQKILKPVPTSVSNKVKQKYENKITPEKIDYRTSIQNKEPEETNGSFVGLFIIFLILIIGASGGYYFISHLTPVKNAATQSTYKGETTASDQTPIEKLNDSSLVLAEAKTPEIHESNITPPTKSISEQKPEDPVSLPSTSNLNQDSNSNPEIKADEYHASIKQEQDTITIELDGPLPPAIKNIESSAAANDSPKELTNKSGEENIVTTDALETESPELELSKSKTSEKTPLNPEIEKADSVRIKSNNQQKNKSVEIIHIIMKGDTLWAIAKHYLLNPFRYPELAKLSKIKNPDLIYPGNRVRIIYRKTTKK